MSYPKYKVGEKIEIIGNTIVFIKMEKLHLFMEQLGKLMVKIFI